MGARAHEKPIVAVLSTPEEGRPPGLESLEAEAELRFATDLEGLIEAVADADVLLVTDFRTTIARDAWPHARRLQWVHATSAGVDAILFPEMQDSEVPVTNARGIFDRGIAEMVLGYILTFAKDLHGSLRLQQAHRWRHRDTERIDGRRLAVVGAGSIGREIARLTRAAGMDVVGVARHGRTDDPDFSAVYASERMHFALAGADFVVVAAPLTDATRGLFDRSAFAAMKPGSRFVNIGRGPIVKTADLVDALQSGHLGGAALDVFEEEPLPADHPLWDMPQVIVTAHMAGDFIGWREALSRQFIANFHRWRKGEPLVNLIDKQRGYGTRQHPENTQNDP
ncbi:MAG: D-2-hydroxyacid dehydrogenase [Chromatiales bacterium]|jgi:phosphoglycerate dehydrogenase-like enzyme